MVPSDDWSLIAHARDNIEGQLHGVDPGVIESTVRDEIRALRKCARVQTFVAILAERRARDRLVAKR